MKYQRWLLDSRSILKKTWYPKLMVTGKPYTLMWRSTKDKTIIALEALTVGKWQEMVKSSWKEYEHLIVMKKWGSKTNGLCLSLHQAFTMHLCIVYYTHSSKANAERFDLIPFLVWSSKSIWSPRSLSICLLALNDSCRINTGIHTWKHKETISPVNSFPSIVPNLVDSCWFLSYPEWGIDVPTPISII